MPRRDPVLIVIQTTRVRLPNGRVVTLTPGCKSEEVSDQIKRVLSTKAKREELQARGRIVEDTPPW